MASPVTSDQNVGHGWVRPRPDGMKAKCGGPAICRECAAEAGAPLPEPPELYYLQTRGYAGNSLLWWRQGRHGYTADIKQAHVFTRAEAYGQANVRPTEDFPWRKDYIDARLQHHVNSETVSRKDEDAI